MGSDVAVLDHNKDANMSCSIHLLQAWQSGNTTTTVKVRAMTTVKDIWLQIKITNTQQ